MAHFLWDLTNFRLFYAMEFISPKTHITQRLVSLAFTGWGSRSSSAWWPDGEGGHLGVSEFLLSICARKSTYEAQPVHQGVELPLIEKKNDLFQYKREHCGNREYKWRVYGTLRLWSWCWAQIGKQYVFDLLWWILIKKYAKSRIWNYCESWIYYIDGMR